MLADTIKDIRRRNYLNQTEFANKIGVTQGTVSQWEHGLTRPNSDQLRSISNVFNISIDDLLKGESLIKPFPEVPKTQEARLLAKGVDKMPEAQRKAILNMMTGLYPGQFEKGNERDDT
jgi:transcriptional regulator with XRE-family HTH domain